MGGYFISRDSTQQAKEGQAVDYEDMRPGDLAFFYQTDDQIDHVGIVLEDQKIIHASGEVRVDNLTEEGIVIEETSEKSHSLSLIRRILH
jgi:cell wall-associated NlpC family hydrolase